MFKHIRNKITLFNTLILIAFLLIFILIIIFIVRINLKNSGEIYLKNLANDLIEDENISSNYALANTTFHEKLGYSYIIWNANKAIIAQNTNESQIINEAHQLITQDNTKDYETLNMPLGEFRVYTRSYSIDNQRYTLQIFQDVTAENEIIAYFITYLVIIGLIGIVALVPISYVIAGRSLIPIKKTFEDQKQFIADASHELRSPLNVIQTSLDVLEFKENETIKENMKWLNNIAAECDNMSELISQLLLIAQVDNDKLTFQSEEVNISDLALEVVELLNESAELKNIKINSDIEDKVLILGDKGKITQLIRIFLDNAIKYTNEDGHIDISLKKDKKNILLSIKDNGIGISDVDLDKIFDRFYRCDEARSRTEGGNGLGLNIAKSIVEYYNGKINTNSEIGKGTEFEISLPI